MAGHRFGRADGDLFRKVAKNPLESAGFDDITERRGSSMRVDVADVFRLELGILEGRFYDAVGAVAVGGGLRDVVGVAGHSVADDFREDGGIAFLRVLK